MVNTAKYTLNSQHNRAVKMFKKLTYHYLLYLENKINATKCLRQKTGK